MGFLDINGNYYEGDRQGQDRVVPQRPSPDHYPVFEADEFTFVEWTHDPARNKAAIGKIPTREFLEHVFEPPADGSRPNNVWERFDEVTRIVPALTQKLAGEHVRGTRAEIDSLGQWLLAFGPDRQPVAEPGVGSLITPEEYARILALLDEYGVQ